jgi:hypothetical protein
MSEDTLLSYDDLATRWRPWQTERAEMLRWLRRRCEKWGIRKLDGTRGDGARFRLADVLKGEARAAGQKGAR